MMTLEQSIALHASRIPDKIAVECAGDRITYGNLWNAIVERSEELKAAGLRENRPYVFRATQNIAFVVTYCAVHYLGAIAVPLENQALEMNFQAVRDEVESCSFAPDIVDILYTTGTTGKSKGVMLSETALTS